MELTDILALVKAGYTRDEIAQMDTPTTPVSDPQPVPAPVQTPSPVAEPQNVETPVPAPVAPAVPAPTPAPVPTQTPQQTPPQPTMEDIMQGIAKLTSAVQANAIAHSVIPQGLTTPPKAEDMLAEIIRPTFKERG